MYRVEILRVNETSPIERANLARKNHGYEDRDILLVFDRSELIRVESIYGVCQTCGETLETIEEARDHMETHLNRPTYPCPVCGTPFDTQQEMIAHIVTHQQVQ